MSQDIVRNNLLSSLNSRLPDPNIKLLPQPHDYLQNSDLSTGTSSIKPNHQHNESWTCKDYSLSIPNPPGVLPLKNQKEVNQKINYDDDDDFYSLIKDLDYDDEDDIICCENDKNARIKARNAINKESKKLCDLEGFPELEKWMKMFDPQEKQDLKKMPDLERKPDLEVKSDLNKKLGLENKPLLEKKSDIDKKSDVEKKLDVEKKPDLEKKLDLEKKPVEKKLDVEKKPDSEKKPDLKLKIDLEKKSKNLHKPRYAAPRRRTKTNVESPLISTKALLKTQESAKFIKPTKDLASNITALQSTVTELKLKLASQQQVLDYLEKSSQAKEKTTDNSLRVANERIEDLSSSHFSLEKTVKNLENQLNGEKTRVTDELAKSQAESDKKANDLFSILEEKFQQAKREFQTAKDEKTNNSNFEDCNDNKHNLDDDKNETRCEETKDPAFQSLFASWKIKLLDHLSSSDVPYWQKWNIINELGPSPNPNEVTDSCPLYQDYLRNKHFSQPSTSQSRNLWLTPLPTTDDEKISMLFDYVVNWKIFDSKSADSIRRDLFQIQVYSSLGGNFPYSITFIEYKSETIPEWWYKALALIGTKIKRKLIAVKSCYAKMKNDYEPLRSIQISGRTIRTDKSIGLVMMKSWESQVRKLAAIQGIKEFMWKEKDMLGVEEFIKKSVGEAEEFMRLYEKLMMKH
ncbi:hypothetical protein SteCoe_8883 [Stentor coeruleus]|uniref:Uncharacterized protein n=1 Tax=Stentor coeruleus TaxID=5963 RepID=A0A1R2CJ76_9CILI|nr:hypothetical protein SteCoe_8883 [Stentor coeruleus]